MTEHRFQNRETWLEAAKDLLVAEFFTGNGIDFTAKVRVSVGWPGSTREAVMACCYHEEASTDQTREIFVSPMIEEDDILHTLLHELGHAHLPDGTGHKKPFKQLMDTFGLVGKVTATYAEEGSETWLKLSSIYQQLGKWPHAKMIKKQKPKKDNPWVRYYSPSFPDLKIVVNRKKVEEFGIPLDPNGRPFKPCKPQDDEGDEE